MADCALCYVEYGGEANQPCAFPCGHVFCYSCICSLQSLGCPGCRWAPEYADSDTPNKDLVTKLFIDFSGVQEERATYIPQASTALKEAAFDTAQRLKDLVPDATDLDVEAIAEDAQKWIDGMDAIQDVEIKVGLARVQFELSTLAKTVKINQDAVRQARQFEKDARKLQTFNGNVTRRLENTRSEFSAYKKSSEEREHAFLLEKEVHRDEIRENERCIRRMAKEIATLKDRVMELLPVGKEADNLRKTISTMTAEKKEMEVTLGDTKKEMIKIRRDMMESRTQLEAREEEIHKFAKILLEERTEVDRLRVQQRTLLEDIESYKSRARMAEKKAAECSRQLSAYASENQSAKHDRSSQEDMEETEAGPSRDKTLTQGPRRIQISRTRASSSIGRLQTRTRLGSSTFGGALDVFNEDVDDLDPLEDSEDRPGEVMTTRTHIDTSVAPLNSRNPLQETKATIRSREQTSRDRSIMLSRLKRARASSPEGSSRPETSGHKITWKKRCPSTRYYDSSESESE
ncbi:hypothetical protein FRC03_005078 [Tulasnella sp. 419]|nr:hypothetical protein FRC03_005078 [Tulasnella sp. 419]